MANTPNYNLLIPSPTGTEDVHQSLADNFNKIDTQMKTSDDKSQSVKDEVTQARTSPDGSVQPNLQAAIKWVYDNVQQQALGVEIVPMIGQSPDGTKYEISFDDFGGIITTVSTGAVRSLVGSAPNGTRYEITFENDGDIISTITTLPATTLIGSAPNGNRYDISFENDGDLVTTENETPIYAQTTTEVQAARTSVDDVTHPSLKAHLDAIEGDIATNTANITTNTNQIGNLTKNKTNWINVTQAPYNAKGDGVTDDTTSFTNALNDLSDFGTLYVPNGTYMLNSFTINNKSITIQAESEKVLIIGLGSGALSCAIRFNSDWTDIQSVSTITNTNDAVITCTDASKYAVGDVIKIVSEDTVPGYEGTDYETSYGGKLRNGEYKRVIAVNTSSNTITVNGLLRYTYTTTVRIGKQGKHTLKVLGKPTLGYLAAVYGIYLTGGMDHKLDLCAADYSEHSTLQMEATYGLKCHMKIGKKSNTYAGIDDRNSSHFTLSWDAKNCRHPFTTGHPRYSTNTAFYCYGMSEYGTVENSFVDGTVQATYDTHEQGYKMVYRNCRVINNTDYVGLQVRGKDIVHENMHVEANIGIQVDPFNRTGTDGRVTFNNCTVDSKTVSLLRYTVTFNNCTFITRDSNQTFTITDCTVEFNNCRFRVLNNTASNSLFKFEGTNTARFNNCNVVYGVYASNCKLILINSGTSNIIVNNISVRSEVSASSFIGLRFGSIDGTGSQLLVNTINLDTTNGLAYYNGTDDFNTFTVGLLKSNFPNFVFKMTKSVNVNKGTDTYSGNGSGTSRTIAHGLGATPSFFQVTPSSLDAGTAGIKYATADATNIYVFYNTAVPSGTNNIKLVWKAEA